ncbi:alpha/beta fold hydrolase [Sphaerisporangium viridialbum]|uniref:alpha/beta fold hydrolase n=1 Tax=Sphaerisporangium viridialbum TaxID=46189 RepID=UPI003C78B546
MKGSPQFVRDYSKGQVRSADGTTIGYRQRGRGPALILVHGGMQASQHFTRLAAALSTDFTVYVPDRRGRGLSGPHGDRFGVLREVDDLRALVAATGASRIFGLSSGALVTLRTALATPALDRVVLYEPPLSVDGSVPMDWVPRFDRETAAGKLASALVTALKGLGTEPVLGRIPRFVLVPLMAVGSRLQRDVPEDEVPIEALVPTLHFDLRIVREMADTVKDYAALDAQVLLLNGARSPAYFRVALDALSAVLPHSRRVSFSGLGHSGPDNDGDPPRVGEALRDFFLDTAHSAADGERLLGR